MQLVTYFSILFINILFLCTKNVGTHYELWSTGVIGPVVVHGIDQGKRDLTWQNGHIRSNSIRHDILLFDVK